MKRHTSTKDLYSQNNSLNERPLPMKAISRKTNSWIKTAARFGVLLFLFFLMQASSSRVFAHGPHEVTPGKSKIPTTLSGILFGIDDLQKDLQRSIREKKLSNLHDIGPAIYAYTSALQQFTKGFDTGKMDTLKKSINKIKSLSDLLHNAGDAKDPVKAKLYADKLDTEIMVVKNLFPPTGTQSTLTSDAVKNAPSNSEETNEQSNANDTYICPMCEGVSSDKPGKCPTCGMSLVKSKNDGHGHGASEPTIQSFAASATPLEVGKPTTVTVKLTTKSNGKPVTPAMLEIAHTERVHLLIIDHSLTDYHHEHPKPSSLPGEYDFSFTPQKPGPYRVWADLVPTETNMQEYVIADIAGAGEGGAVAETETKLVDTVEGLRYELSFEDANLVAGKATGMKLRITQTDNTPFLKLEPLMNAFAHMVGFNTDFKTVVHIHPLGEEPTSDTERGGPELSFHLLPERSGFIRLFAQVQIGGESKYARFGINVAEGSISGSHQH